MANVLDAARNRDTGQLTTAAEGSHPNVLDAARNRDADERSPAADKGVLAQRGDGVRDGGVTGGVDEGATLSSSAAVPSAQTP